MRELMRRALAVVVTVGRSAASPLFVVCVLIVVGAACAILGVFLWAGSPAALLTAAAICFVLAWLMLRGQDPNV